LYKYMSTLLIKGVKLDHELLFFLICGASVMGEFGYLGLLSILDATWHEC
jgi:hypothetical protein